MEILSIFRHPRVLRVDPAGRVQDDPAKDGGDAPDSQQMGAAGGPGE